ncbi:MAG TPA: hypothetical protein PLE64_11395, partial [Spirochaetota bacterium]|nr:hypothetical protein [Spirochaetota bacterium]
MEDIIFAGTDQRKPLSLAEVSLVINNTNRILHIDSDTVTVTRRVFRDGESEYMINKSPVRLKDIEKLFLDTGLGKASYSVMEQGKIDLILSTKAEDRRYIFEEAAGISRFKVQKKESLKKLEDTTVNLARLNDIIKEVEREKDLKSKQAEKTKIYFGLREKYKRNDISLQLLRYRDFQKKLQKVTEDREKLFAEREELSKKVTLISSENENDEKRKNDIQLQLFEWDKKLHTYTIKLEDIDGKTSRNKQLIQQQEQQITATRQRINEIDETVKKLTEEKEKNIQQSQIIVNNIASDKQQLENLYTHRKKKIQNIHSFRDAIEQKKHAIKDFEITVKKLRESLEIVIKQLVDAIEKRKSELESSESQREQVREQIHSELAEAETCLQNALHNLSLNLVDEAIQQLKKIKFDVLKQDIQLFENYEDGFRSILFDKTGIHAEKERLDKAILKTTEDIETLRNDINQLELSIHSEQEELDEVNNMITRVEKDLSRNENEKAWIDKHIQTIERQIADDVKQKVHLENEIKKLQHYISELVKEIEQWQNSMVEFNEKSNDLKQQIHDLIVKRDEIEKKIIGRKQSSKKDMEQLQRLADRISSLDKNIVELQFRLNSIEEYLWTEYETRLTDTSIKLDESLYESINSELQNIKQQIQELGPINNLAIEEYKDLKKRFEYYIEQKKDIEKAREDILSVIADINKQSVDLFLQTFKEIQKNFQEIFKQLFNGGEAIIELTDPENVLESGIEIIVRPPGKKNKNINMLSGGERSMIAIALLFATYMVKASPFCFLDEIDAALDEENIGRFIRLVQKFSKSTQFVIVTHNKKTMSVCDSIFGVTMEEPGVSKVLSVKLETAYVMSK